MSLFNAMYVSVINLTYFLGGFFAMYFEPISVCAIFMVLLRYSSSSKRDLDEAFAEMNLE